MAKNKNNKNGSVKVIVKDGQMQDNIAKEETIMEDQNTTNTEVEETSKEDTLIEQIMPTPKEIEEIIPETIGELYIYIKARFDALEDRTTKSAVKHGNASTRQMVEDDARRVILGDLKDKSHKACAIELGLSYGQIYSARGGYTFKTINAEKENIAAVDAKIKK